MRKERENRKNGMVRAEESETHEVAEVKREGQRVSDGEERMTEKARRRKWRGKACGVLICCVDETRRCVMIEQEGSLSRAEGEREIKTRRPKRRQD